MSSLSVPEFVTRWQSIALSERSAAQQHFLDLCAVLDQPTPAATDPTGAVYTFERGVTKVSGGGWADVWKRGYFGWEYKGKHKDLTAAYRQLLQYREDLENPPLLIVCDLNRFEVHTNYTGTIKQVYAFNLADLLVHEPTSTCALPPLDVLRAVFEAPERLRPARTTEQVTQLAAKEFGELALSLASRSVPAEDAARFLMRLLFCLFAEDMKLLPDGLFTKLLQRTAGRPDEFSKRLAGLFEAMAVGGSFGADDIAYFDGGLFADSSVLPLTSYDLTVLARAAALDWASVEPAIFGTLFERSLDPAKRSQLGAHYTSAEDILLIVEPVLMAPLQRKWDRVRAAVQVEVSKVDASRAGQAARERAQKLLRDFVSEIAAVRVLDPACGSGNFLYIALKCMLDLWKEVNLFAMSQALPGALPYDVGPQQLFGIELNVYAHELASIVVWIGYLQWLHDNGYGIPHDPILRPLSQISCMDAILAVDDVGKTVKPAWPEIDVIIGNPPFLGGKLLRRELGDKYVQSLFSQYDGAVSREADLVCYWFERTRAMIESTSAKRAGLLATQSIRGGANRRVLERINESGRIFMAWSDRPWILDGASVHVSLIGFDTGSELRTTLNGAPVAAINANLTAALDLTRAAWLEENSSIAFMGDTKGGPFDIDHNSAQRMLASPANPNGRPNSDVVRPWVNGLDLTRRPRNYWIVDFGTTMSVEDAALYEAPFEYIRSHVLASRASSRTTRSEWCQ